MASGIAHRRTKPAIFKLNVYPRRSPHASRWSPPGDTDHARRYNTVKKSRQRCFLEPTHPERLSAIAVEIIHEILLELDLPSLENMRQLNSHFQILVESLSAYRLLKQHTFETLRVIYLSGVASTISVKQLFIEFRQPSCRGCDSFGPFLFLPSVSRCCESCLQTKKDFQMFPVSKVYTNFAISPSKARNWLPVVRCPRGNYGNPWSANSCQRSIDHVSFAQVERLGIQTHGNKRKMSQAVREKHAKYICRLESRRKTSWPPVGSNLPMTLRSDLDFYLWQWKCRGVTDLPFWDSKRKATESGVYCSACGLHRCFKKIHNVWYDRSKGNIAAFTLDTIPRHFEHCESLKKGYKFGDRYRFYNSEELGLDFLVNGKGEIEPHPASGKGVPERYINPHSGVYIG